MVADLDLRRHDVGELRHRQRAERDQAGDRDDHGDDERQPRPADEDRGDGHDGLPARHRRRAPAPRSAPRSCPRRTRCWPWMMTFSPAFRPSLDGQQPVAGGADLDAALLDHVLVVDRRRRRSRSGRARPRLRRSPRPSARFSVSSTTRTVWPSVSVSFLLSNTARTIWPSVLGSTVTSRKSSLPFSG